MADDSARVAKDSKYRLATTVDTRKLTASLVKVKDKVLTSMKSNVVYGVSCGRGKVYIGETIRRLETRITCKEHEDAFKKGTTEKSAIAEHAWTTNNTIDWSVTTMLDQARKRKELMIKEALHISADTRGSTLQ